MQMMKKESTQSIAVSAEEKMTIEVLAVAARMKPATFARHILYRGLSQYLQDREVHAQMTDEQIYVELVKLIEEDESLARIKEVIELRKELERAPQPSTEQEGHRVPLSKPGGGVSRAAPSGQKKRVKT